MPEITEAQLRERFSKEDFAGTYFLYGEEKVLIKREIQRLLKKMNITAFPEFNQNELPHTATVDQIADAALALPFFAEQKKGQLFFLLAFGCGDGEQGGAGQGPLCLQYCSKMV